MSSHSPVRFDVWENVIKPFTAVTNDLSLDNLQWTVHSYLSAQNGKKSGSRKFGHFFVFTECV